MIPNYGWTSRYARDVQTRAALIGLDLRDVLRRGEFTGERAYWAGSVQVSKPIPTPTRASAWLDGWEARGSVQTAVRAAGVTA